MRWRVPWVIPCTVVFVGVRHGIKHSHGQFHREFIEYPNGISHRPFSGLTRPAHGFNAPLGYPIAILDGLSLTAYPMGNPWNITLAKCFCRVPYGTSHDVSVSSSMGQMLSWGFLRCPHEASRGMSHDVYHGMVCRTGWPMRCIPWNPMGYPMGWCRKGFILVLHEVPHGVTLT